MATTLAERFRRAPRGDGWAAVGAGGLTGLAGEGGAVTLGFGAGATGWAAFAAVVAIGGAAGGVGVAGGTAGGRARTRAGGGVSSAVADLTRDATTARRRSVIKRAPPSAARQRASRMAQFALPEAALVELAAGNTDEPPPLPPLLPLPLPLPLPGDDEVASLTPPEPRGFDRSLAGRSDGAFEAGRNTAGWSVGAPAARATSRVGDEEDDDPPPPAHAECRARRPPRSRRAAVERGMSSRAAASGRESGAPSRPARSPSSARVTGGSAPRQPCSRRTLVRSRCS